MGEKLWNSGGRLKCGRRRLRNGNARTTIIADKTEFDIVLMAHGFVPRIIAEGKSGMPQPIAVIKLCTTRSRL
jgi:hypothetical protein